MDMFNIIVCGTDFNLALNARKFVTRENVHVGQKSYEGRKNQDRRKSHEGRKSMAERERKKEKGDRKIKDRKRLPKKVTEKGYLVYHHAKIKDL